MPYTSSFDPALYPENYMYSEARLGAIWSCSFHSSSGRATPALASQQTSAVPMPKQHGTIEQDARRSQQMRPHARAQEVRKSDESHSNSMIPYSEKATPGARPARTDSAVWHGDVSMQPRSSHPGRVRSGPSSAPIASRFPKQCKGVYIDRCFCCCILPATAAFLCPGTRAQGAGGTVHSPGQTGRLLRSPDLAPSSSPHPRASQPRSLAASWRSGEAARRGTGHGARGTGFVLAGGAPSGHCSHNHGTQEDCSPRTSMYSPVDIGQPRLVLIQMHVYHWRSLAMWQAGAAKGCPGQIRSAEVWLRLHRPIYPDDAVLAGGTPGWESAPILRIS
ncbi:hypothetical protein JHW43_006717 [Diplocarpon mali]|nr:hypothetical protein JHW43_006717 [Diplocarpon mali]